MKHILILFTAALFLQAEIFTLSGTLIRSANQSSLNDDNSSIGGATVTLKGKFGLHTTTTDATGRYEFHIVYVPSVIAETSSQKATPIRIANNQISFGSLDLKKVEVYNLRGQRVYQQKIPSGASVAPLPTMAKGLYLISLTHQNNHVATLNWSGGSQNAAVHLFGRASTDVATLGVATAAIPQITAFTPDTLTFTADGYAELKIPINVAASIFPTAVYMIDSTYGTATDITLLQLSLETNDTITLYDTITTIATEQFAHITMEDTRRVIMTAEGYYSSLSPLVSPHSGFVPIDLDSVTSPETGIYGTLFQEENTISHYTLTDGTTLQCRSLCYSGYDGGAYVELWDSSKTTLLATTEGDQLGRYYFPDVDSGTYRILANGNNGINSPKCREIINTDVTRRADFVNTFGYMTVAPNIYLYPLDTTEVAVNVTIRENGTIPFSIPEYNDGWKVTATPDGNIDDSLGFLYYDFISPIPYQSDSGWTLSYANFDQEVTTLLTARGLNQQEILDFIDFWKRYIPACDWVTLCPIDADVMVELEVTPTPLTLFRELYLVLPASGQRPTLPEPTLGTPFERKGFTVVEWGGHLKGLKLQDVKKDKLK